MAPFPLEAHPPEVDRGAEEAARVHQAQLTKPTGSLAELEGVAITLAAIQGSARPLARPAEALLFAADHPIAAHGVSAYPPEVTAQMVNNFVAGGAAASVLCRHLHVPLTVIDVGVNRSAATSIPPPPPAPPRRRADEPPAGERARRQQAEHVAYREQLERAGVRLVRDPVADEREGDLREAQAMSAPTFERAVAAGVAAVDRLAEGTRVVILGEMGIGNTTCAAAVAAALLERDGAELTGRGTGVDDDALERKRAVVQRAAALVRGQPAARVLAAVGGRELAALAGAIGRAAERRICVLVDGFIVSTAALAAVRATPAIRPYLLFAHRSAEPGHHLVLDALAARPLLDLGLRLGEGSGALAAFPLVELACALHAEMATFASAGVSGGG
jgi:nicotinate-nucleotide--dimethylbenzimidazole phosphoribosyltransferase